MSEKDPEEINLVRQAPSDIESVFAPDIGRGTDVVAPEPEDGDVKLIGGCNCECGPEGCKCGCNPEQTG